MHFAYHFNNNNNNKQHSCSSASASALKHKASAAMIRLTSMLHLRDYWTVYHNVKLNSFFLVDYSAKVYGPIPQPYVYRIEWKRQTVKE